MIKVYAIAGILVAAFGYVGYSQWRISNLEDNYQSEKESRQQFESSLNQERESRRLEAFAREQYLAELEKAEDEKERLEKCIADKSCVATVRVRVPTGCVPGSGGAGGTETVRAELDPVAGLNSRLLRDRLKKLQVKYKFCQATLNSWATNPTQSP